MFTVTFHQLFRVFPTIVQLVSTKHAHFYEPPGHGCVNIVHDKLDVFGINCCLPTYCGKSVYKDRLPESTFFTGYYLCQRLSEPIETRSWNIHFDFEMHPFFPGFGKYDMIIDDLTIIELQNRYIVMSLASQPYRPQRLFIDDICQYTHGDEKVYAYTQMSRTVQTWDVFDKIDMEKMLHLPYGLTFIPEESSRLYIMPQCPISTLSLEVRNDALFLININQYLNCLGNFCELFTTYDEECVFPFLYDNKLYYECTREGWDAHWCSAENYENMTSKSWRACKSRRVSELSLGVKRILNFNSEHGTNYLSNELNERVQCDDIIPTVSTENDTNFAVLNQNRLCGIYELEEPSYGISMQYNSTHYVKNNELLRSHHSYYCDAVIPVITDIMDIGGTVSVALNFILSLLVYFVQEIFIILRGISVNFDALFSKLLYELVQIINALFEAIIYLLTKLELLRPLCYGAVVFLTVDLTYHNRVLSTLCFAFAVYLYVNVDTSN